MPPEIWFGTHVAAPSKIILENGSTELLSDHIQKNPANILGEKVAQQWNNNLPFLFKVNFIPRNFDRNVVSQTRSDPLSADFIY